MGHIKTAPHHVDLDTNGDKALRGPSLQYLYSGDWEGGPTISIVNARESRQHKGGNE